MHVIKSLSVFWRAILLLKIYCGRKFLYIFGLLRQRNAIVKDIHTEFRALNIEIPSVVEQKTEGFASFLEDLADEPTSEERVKETPSSSDR